MKHKRNEEKHSWDPNAVHVVWAPPVCSHSPSHSPSPLFHPLCAPYSTREQWLMAVVGAGWWRVGRGSTGHTFVTRTRTREYPYP